MNRRDPQMLLWCLLLMRFKCCISAAFGASAPYTGVKVDQRPVVYVRWRFGTSVRFINTVVWVVLGAVTTGFPMCSNFAAL